MQQSWKPFSIQGSFSLTYKVLSQKSPLPQSESCQAGCCGNCMEFDYKTGQWRPDRSAICQNQKGSAFPLFKELYKHQWQGNKMEPVLYKQELFEVFLLWISSVFAQLGIFLPLLWLYWHLLPVKCTKTLLTLHLLLKAFHHLLFSWFWQC